MCLYMMCIWLDMSWIWGGGGIFIFIFNFELWNDCLGTGTVKWVVWFCVGLGLHWYLRHSDAGIYTWNLRILAGCLVRSNVYVHIFDVYLNWHHLDFSLGRWVFSVNFWFWNSEMTVSGPRQSNGLFGFISD
jgi:hypothetical protein